MEILEIIGFEGTPVMGGIVSGPAIVRVPHSGSVWTTEGVRITDGFDARVAAGGITLLTSAVGVPTPECGLWFPMVVCIAHGGLIDPAMSRALMPPTAGNTGDPEYRFLVFRDKYAFTAGVRAATDAVKCYLASRHLALDIAQRLIDACLALSPDDATLLAMRATLNVTQACDARFSPATLTDPFAHTPHPNSAEEHCRICGHLAAHKIAEEGAGARHPYTAYLCCTCFGHVFGPTAERWCGGEE
jgi:hypothetical protein